MPFGLGRTPSRELTHAGITLARQRRRGRWLLAPLLLGLALALGAAIGYVLHEHAAPVVVARLAAPDPELAPLRRQLDEARLALQLSEARSHELERQIDVLTQQLAESLEQLTFVRKAREGKR
jgi:hypothetical protein